MDPNFHVMEQLNASKDDSITWDVCQAALELMVEAQATAEAEQAQDDAMTEEAFEVCLVDWPKPASSTPQSAWGPSVLRGRPVDQVEMRARGKRALRYTELRCQYLEWHSRR